MFNLESSISAWRNQMLVARLSPDALDELESHLRDDIAQQLRSGLNTGQAFDAAAQSIGRPAALQNEFGKINSLGRFADRAKNSLLSFAGIPNHYLSMNNPSANLDSRNATYLRSAAFLLPAACLWLFAMIYVVPAFKAVWDGSADRANAAGLDNLLRFNFDLLSLFKNGFFYITGFTTVVLAVLEWRSRRWPRYRRAIIGAGVFLLNLAVLFSFAVMFLGATFAARQFAAQAKSNSQPAVLRHEPSTPAPH